MSVALRLADDIDVGRGSTIVRPQNQPTVSSSFECLLCWMSEQALSPRRRYLVKHTTRTAMVGSVDIRYRLDVESLRRDEDVSSLEMNDLARVHMQLSAPLVFDSYRRNRVTGSLIVIDEATNETVAAGVILDTEVEEAAEVKSERSPNVRWQGTRMTRERRWSALGHAGATLWFTGLPGAGKSTVAGAVEGGPRAPRERRGARRRAAVFRGAPGGGQVAGRGCRRGAPDRGGAARFHARRQP